MKLKDEQLQAVYSGHDVFANRLLKEYLFPGAPLSLRPQARSGWWTVYSRGFDGGSSEEFGVEAVVISSGSRLEDSAVDRATLENPLLSDRVCAVVVDEAHCVSKW